MATVWERLFSCLFYVHGILRTYYQLSCIYTATIMSCAIFLSIEQQLNSLCLINTTIPTELTVSSCCPCQILTWSHSLNSSDWTSESEVRFLKNHFSRKVGRTSSAEGMPIAEKKIQLFSHLAIAFLISSAKQILLTLHFERIHQFSVIVTIPRVRRDGEQTWKHGKCQCGHLEHQR